MTALLVAPIRRDERVLGTLHIYRERGHEWREDAHLLAAGLADQAATAIENATRYAGLQDSLERAKIPARVNQLLTAALDLDVMLREIAGAAVTITGAELATLWLADEETKALTLAVFSDESIGSGRTTRRLGFGEGWAGWVAQHRRPLAVDDVFADERTIEPELVAPPRPFQLLLDAGPGRRPAGRGDLDQRPRADPGRRREPRPAERAGRPDGGRAPQRRALPRDLGGEPAPGAGGPPQRAAAQLGRGRRVRRGRGRADQLRQPGRAADARLRARRPAPPRRGCPAPPPRGSRGGGPARRPARSRRRCATARRTGPRRTPSGGATARASRSSAS